MAVTRPIPKSFREACAGAQAGKESYERAGYELARLSEARLKNRLDDEDVLRQKLDGLKASLNPSNRRAPDPRAIVGWFAAMFTKEMLLVPAKRQDEFAKGVIRAYGEGLLLRPPSGASAPRP